MTRIGNVASAPRAGGLTFVLFSFWKRAAIIVKSLQAAGLALSPCPTLGAPRTWRGRGSGKSTLRQGLVELIDAQGRVVERLVGTASPPAIGLWGIERCNPACRCASAPANAARGRVIHAVPCGTWCSLCGAKPGPCSVGLAAIERDLIARRPPRFHSRQRVRSPSEPR